MFTRTLYLLAASVPGALLVVAVLFFVLHPVGGVAPEKLETMQWIGAMLGAAAGLCGPAAFRAFRSMSPPRRGLLQFLGAVSGFATGWFLFAYGPVPTTVFVPVELAEPAPLPGPLELRRLTGILEDRGFAAQGEALNEVGNVRDSAGNAILRVAEASAAHDMKAADALEALEGGDPAPVLDFLDADRARKGDELADRTREIAALAFLGGQTSRAEEELGKILATNAEDIEAINALGNIRLLKGEVRAAEQAYRRVAEIAARTNDLAGQAAALGNLGLLARRAGDFKEAAKQHTEALKLHQKLAQPESCAADRVNLAMALAGEGSYDASDALLLKALEAHEVLNLRPAQAGDLLNLGVNAQKRQNLADARVFYERARKLCEEIGNDAGLAAATGNLGTIADLEGDLPEAIRLGRAALELEEKLGGKEGIARVALSLGMSLRKTGKPEEAREARRLIERARDLYTMLGMTPLSSIANSELAKIPK